MVEHVGESVAAALLVALLIAWLRKHRLYLAVPKTPMATPLSSGEVHYLTLSNLGFTLTEDISIGLHPGPEYTLLATSARDLVLLANRITLPRLDKGKSVTFALMVERGTFTRDAVESLASKGGESKAIAGSSSTAATPAPLLLVLLIFLFFAVPFLFGTSVGAP